MITTGFGHLYVETHNWAEAVAFWQHLGFEMELRDGAQLGHAPAPRRWCDGLRRRAIAGGSAGNRVVPRRRGGLRGTRRCRCRQPVPRRIGARR